ncbi:MAG: OmpA family protein [Acidobacteriota bacterium]
MRKHVLAVVTVAIATTILAVMLLVPAAADAKRYRAFVYPDRANPTKSVVVDDFRVNETVWDEGGVQYIWVHGPAGSFQMSFRDIQQLEVTEYLGLTRVDWARYEVKVTGTNAETYTGVIELRVMRGVADGIPWYHYPATHVDRGSGLCRVVIGESSVAPTVPCEAPKREERPIEVMPSPVPPPRPMPTEDELFAMMTVDELNARQVLSDVYFDFDRATLRPDGVAALQRNVAFLVRWPSVVVRLEGYTDPRGTNEYNYGLGERRAGGVAQYLMANGIAAGRIQMVSNGEAEQVCSESSESCWARNRRTHFVIVAK